MILLLFTKETLRDSYIVRVVFLVTLQKLIPLMSSALIVKIE